MNRSCRLCLTHDAEVYSEMDTENCLAQLKSVIPEIDLSLTECPLICTNCSDLLLSAYNFKQNCLKTEEKLKLSLSESKNKVSNEYLCNENESEHESTDIDNTEVEQSTEDAHDIQSVKEELIFECEETQVISNNTMPAKESVQEKTKTINKQIESKLTCKFCGLQLGTYLDWYNHIKVHSANSNYCDICLKNFESRSQYLKHRETHRMNKCGVCGQEFLYKSTFSRHMKTEHPEQNRNQRTARKFLPGMAGKYQCDMCGLKTKEKCQLVEHIRTHTGERPYKCSLCDKAFAQSSTLSTHIKSVHLTERPFQCEICGKGYAVRGAYNIHRKSHLDLPKNFVCDHCGKAFAMQGRLNSHLQKHNPGKTIVCHVCSKSFGHMRGLTKHMRIHTGEKPYECTICQKRFTQQYNMRIHLRSCARRNAIIT